MPLQKPLGLLITCGVCVAATVKSSRQPVTSAEETVVCASTGAETLCSFRSAQQQMPSAAENRWLFCNAAPVPVAFPWT